MTVRACVYKDCENYTLNNVPTGNFTIFAFPKDPERRQLWMELGKVDPQLPPNELYMCSSHFDKKYMSVTSRRTILVGAAVPLAYDSDPGQDMDYQNIDDGCCTDTDTYVLYEEDKRDNGEAKETYISVSTEEDYRVGSTIREDEDSDVADNSANYIENDVISYSNSTESKIIQEVPSGSKPREYIYVRNNGKPESLIRKRKLSPNSVLPVKPKILINKIIHSGGHKTDKTKLEETKAVTTTQRTLTCQDLNKVNDVNEEPHEIEASVEDEPNDEIIDSSQVTAFIIKGQEYVQMSKQYYIDEKATYLKKLKEYERIFKLIEKNITGLNLP